MKVVTSLKASTVFLQHSIESARGSDVLLQFSQEDTKFYIWSLFVLWQSHTSVFVCADTPLTKVSKTQLCSPSAQVTESMAPITRQIKRSPICHCTFTTQHRRHGKHNQILSSYPDVAQGPLRLHTIPATIDVSKQKKTRLSKSEICFIKHISAYSGRGPTYHDLSMYLIIP